MTVGAIILCVVGLVAMIALYAKANRVQQSMKGKELSNAWHLIFFFGMMGVSGAMVMGTRAGYVDGYDRGALDLNHGYVAVDTLSNGDLVVTSLRCFWYPDEYPDGCGVLK